jgi:hypothetical protein
MKKQHYRSSAKALTVKELLEALAKFDPELEIWTEGCDCYGDVGSVDLLRVNADETVVLLARTGE